MTNAQESYLNYLEKTASLPFTRARAVENEIVEEHRKRNGYIAGSLTGASDALGTGFRSKGWFAGSSLSKKNRDNKVKALKERLAELKAQKR